MTKRELKRSALVWAGQNTRAMVGGIEIPEEIEAAGETERWQDCLAEIGEELIRRGGGEQYFNGPETGAAIKGEEE